MRIIYLKPHSIREALIGAGPHQEAGAEIPSLASNTSQTPKKVVLAQIRLQVLPATTPVTSVPQGTLDLPRHLTDAQTPAGSLNFVRIKSERTCRYNLVVIVNGYDSAWNPGDVVETPVANPNLEPGIIAGALGTQAKWNVHTRGAGLVTKLIQQFAKDLRTRATSPKWLKPPNPDKSLTRLIAIGFCPGGTSSMSAITCRACC